MNEQQKVRSTTMLVFFWLFLLLCTSAEAEIHCYDCHGTRVSQDNRPVDASERDISTGGFPGNHQTHLSVDAGKENCAACHPGSELITTANHDGRIKVSAHINKSQKITIYKNQTSAFQQNPTPYPDRTTWNCTNVNCHFQKITPAWGSASFVSPVNCNGCHGFPLTDGSHPSLSGSGKKHNDYYGITDSCRKCHPDHLTSTAHFSHATSAGKRELAVIFTTDPNSGGSYSGDLSYPVYLNKSSSQRNGSCSTLYCHSNGYGGPAKVTPVWGGSLPNNCTGCHGGAGDANVTGLSRWHGKHTDSAAYGYKCNRCHKNTVSGFSNFTINNKGLHVNKVKDVALKDGGNYGSDKACTATYCHSDGLGGAANQPAKWSDSGDSRCYKCHKGTSLESTETNCTAIQGVWSSSKNSCTPDITMSSNGHHRLVGPQWIRKYPCTYCHNDTVKAIIDSNGKITGDGAIRFTNYSSRHVNGTINVLVAQQWNVVGLPSASFDKSSKACTNIYCHSDGTSIPENIRVVGWSEKTACNSCHGHPRGTCNSLGCHDGRTDSNGKTWPVLTGWAAGSEWVGAMPMFPNEGPGSPRANSHPRHNETNLTCDHCHAKTVVEGTCTTCHKNGIPAGSMSEVAHVNPQFHVNKTKDVDFKGGGSYNKSTGVCSNTACHFGYEPVWGGSVNNVVICISCHKTTGGDVDSFGFVADDTRAKINLDEWQFRGHGRYSSAALTGKYPVSGNPAANFPIDNPCWYCHDNNLLHNDQNNPFRLRQHSQFANRFEKECVYCHMQGTDSECLGCHKSAESLSPQLTSPAVIASHSGITYLSGCRNAGCHDSDATLHNTGSTQFWDAGKKDDVKKQYIMMGVCLKCHDDDSAEQCNGCHDYTLPKYRLGFDPGTGYIKPKKARASSSHFGYKHYNDYLADGKWRGGKFCWDCHDPHGDSNIYMIHDQVATTTDGKFGIPLTRAKVVFTRKQSGTDYANSDPFKAYDGICNVCHTASSRHYQSNKGDGHNAGRICTDCHEHRFADSHADGKLCNSCHSNSKPVPKHASFGLPQDCTKCHSGVINKRMDIMGQFNANSHHIQGVQVTNKQCYTCHWESTPDGFIDRTYHEGYDYKNYTGVANAKVDLVVWQAGARPTTYSETTAVQFLAGNMGKAGERAESAKVSNHCLGCHSDQNNDTDPFGDCKTPRIYAWDFLSIGARYSQIGTTPWGKVNSGTYPNANEKDKTTKAFSAHGNVANNQGGYSTVDGIDKNIPDTTGVQNVQCFDCHNSHGSKVTGVTSSYVTFNGTKNGGNLKETQAGKGGYSMSYKASSNTAAGAVNPYNAGAGQCFDCHNTQNSVTTPWGYQSTFGATQPIMGYMDSIRFGNTTSAMTKRYPYKTKSIVGGHLKASGFLNRTTSTQNRINGLCTPCHDPHGVSPSLGANQAYSVPLLKGTWMSSPYREDVANDRNSPAYDYFFNDPTPYVYTDQKSFNGDRVPQSVSTFAGLCTRCHSKSNLTKDACSNPAFNNNSTQCKANGAAWSTNPWKSSNRVHEAVSGWKTSNNTFQHSYTCSKCHTPHASVLPKLTITNCLDWKHRGRQASGGNLPSGGNYDMYNPYGVNGEEWGPGSGGGQMTKCHPGAFPDNSWNSVTPW